MGIRPLAPFAIVSSVAISATLAMLCIAVASTGGSSNVSGDGPNPTPTPFVPPEQCTTNQKYSDGELLAFRQLSLEDGPLVLDEGEWRSLADEIDGVLERVFASSDDVPSVSVRKTFIQGLVSIGLQALGDTLDPVMWGSDYWPPISFGDEAIDALNAAGLAAIAGPRDQTSGYGMTFCLDPPVNVHAARLAYEGLPGIRYASTSGLAGDSSDIAVGRDGGTWDSCFERRLGTVLPAASARHSHTSL